MANARVLVAKIEDVQRSGATMRIVLDSFVFVTGESEVQHHFIEIPISFAAGTFKASMRSGIVQWVLDHLGDTVVNVILPDLEPI